MLSVRVVCLCCLSELSVCVVSLSCLSELSAILRLCLLQYQGEAVYPDVKPYKPAPPKYPAAWGKMKKMEFSRLNIFLHKFTQSFSPLYNQYLLKVLRSLLRRWSRWFEDLGSVSRYLMLLLNKLYNWNSNLLLNVTITLRKYFSCFPR